MKKNLLLVLFTFLTSIPVFSQNLEEGLLLHYNFDNNLEDSSSNEYDATNYGATYTTDRFGNENSAIYFDGINDYINFPNLDALKPELPVSFSFWIKYESDDYQDCEVFTTSYEDDVNSGVYFNSQSSTNKYAVNFANGNANYISSNRRSYVCDEEITTDEWHQIVVTVTSTTNMKIYIDCFKPLGTFSGSGSFLVYSETAGCIGRRDRNLNQSANYFKGAIDDFRYWDRELTVTEISTICNSLSNDEVEQPVKETKLYVNHTTDKLTVISNSTVSRYAIYTMYGTMVQQEDFNDSSKTDFTIPLDHLQHGIYILKTYNSTNNSYSVNKFTF